MSASPAVSKVKLCFAFEVPGRAITVQLNQDLVASLYNEAGRSFRPHDTQAFSGYLIGRIDGEDEVTLTVESSSRRDQTIAFPNKLERWASLRQGRACVIGGYHIQEGDTLDLSDECMDDFRKTFSGLHSVFLLIQPSPNATPIGCMFVGSPGQETGDLPDLRFLFDPYQLNKSAEPSFNADEKRPLPPPAAPPVNQFSGTTPVFDVPALPEKRTQNGKKRIWHFGVALAVLVVIAGAYYLPAFIFKAAERPPVDKSVTVFNGQAVNSRRAETASLGMKVTIQPRGLMITWDDTLAASQIAVHGTLQIRDGQRFRDIPLTRFQIRRGSLLYVPQTDDVDLRLDLVAPDMTRYTDYIKVVGSAMPQLRNEGPEERRSLAVEPAASAPRETAREPMKPSSNPLKKFSPPPASVSRPVQSPDLPAPPQLRESDRTAASISPPLVLNGSTQVPSLPAVEQHPVSPAVLPAPAAPKPEQTRQLAKTEAPKFTDPVLRKKTPVGLPSDLRALAVNMIVVVRITVDAQGHVIKAEPRPEKIAFKSKVAGLVANAVRSWEFAPAELNGKPVRSDFDIQVAIH